MIKGQRPMRIPPAREYARLTFKDKQAIIKAVQAILFAYAETERGNA